MEEYKDVLTNEYEDVETNEYEDGETNVSKQQLLQFMQHGQGYFPLAVQHLSVSQHYMRYVHKYKWHNSSLSGQQYMIECITLESDARCINQFRMEKHVLLTLVYELENNYGLIPSKNMTTLEKVGIFLYTLARSGSNRDVADRFNRSGDTISRAFHQVLDAFVSRHTQYNGFAKQLLEPRDRTFVDVPHKICSEERYSPFKGAIGCIDGVHIANVIPLEDQGPYFGRKKFTSFNVMAVCDFDMYFTFLLVGWEGSAHDAKVFDHAVRTESLNFPHPPEGRYYLCDKGYADKKGYLVPYSKVNYHRSQFGSTPPQNKREGFNKLHSSLRTTIERCFGVLKKRWKIVAGCLPSYPVETQVDIIIACFALHNFILAHKRHDTVEEEEDDTPLMYKFDSNDEEPLDPVDGMGSMRDRMAAAIWANKRAWLRSRDI